MKTCYLLLTLVGLAISLALPSRAQELNAISPKVRQQIEAVFQKFQDAYNARDIDTIAALHTQDAIEVRSWQGWLPVTPSQKDSKPTGAEILARWSTRLLRYIQSATPFAK